MNEISLSSARRWLVQALTLARFEVVGALLRKRAMPLYLLIAMPLLISVLQLLFPDDADINLSLVFAGMFLFLLRFVIFFGCASLFVNLFRGEILDKSLHYLLLLPMRREVTTFGKYLGGVVATVVVFVPTTAIVFLLMFASQGVDKLGKHLAGPGLVHLLTYLTIVVLACIAYGAVFLAAGMVFRNPMIPAALFFLWEMLIPFLPPVLKSMTVIHYLLSLTPVPVPLGPFEILAAPVKPWVAVLGLLGLSLLMLGVSAFKARRLEISYAAE